MTATVVAALLGALLAPDSGAQAIRVTPERPRQGQTVRVVVGLPASAEAPGDVQFDQRTFKMFSLTQHVQGRNADTSTRQPQQELVTWRGLIGIPADLSPGDYDLRVAGESKRLTVLPGHFALQRLRLPKEKDNFIASPGEREAIAAAKAALTDRQLWRGNFISPCKARISAGFGLRRVVNGQLLSDYFHSGLDYAGGLGAPVYAAQRGRVALAHLGWRLDGNVICIDHGQGVISLYAHLQRILVKQGDLVQEGQVIGRVGMTGRANGPHLHFGLYVNQDATNPMDWFTGAP
jgi:murein DD-endopeptidase MepM/ murein hydrolase activator NlpD